jgi:hypothetical protein
MKKHLVSYDLRQPRRDYSALYKRLGEWQATRVLESVWIIKRDVGCEAIRDDLKRFIDTDDGVLVVQLEGTAAWNRLLISDDQMVQLMTT